MQMAIKSAFRVQGQNNKIGRSQKNFVPEDYSKLVVV